MIMIRAVFTISLLLTIAVISMAQEPNTPTLKAPPEEHIVTVAGELKIVQPDVGNWNRFAITLNNNVILKTNGEDETNSRFSDYPHPRILKHLRKKVPPFDEVVIFEQNMWGNACSGGPIWFLGLKKNGSFEISNDIDFCGLAGDPIIKEGLDKITIIVPANRGAGYIPAAVYQNGVFSQIEAPVKRKRKGVSHPSNGKSRQDSFVC
jgi:hypothetical protein